MKKIFIFSIFMFFSTGIFGSNMNLSGDYNSGAIALIGNPANMYTATSRGMFLEYEIKYPELEQEAPQSFSGGFLYSLLPSRLFAGIGYGYNTISDVYSSSKGTLGVCLLYNNMLRMGVVYNFLYSKFNEIKLNKKSSGINIGTVFSLNNFSLLISGYNILLNNTFYNARLRFNMNNELSIMLGYDNSYLNKVELSIGIFYKPADKIRLGMEFNGREYIFSTKIHSFIYMVILNQQELMSLGASHRLSINYEF